MCCQKRNQCNKFYTYKYILLQSYYFFHVVVGPALASCCSYFISQYPGVSVIVMLTCSQLILKYFFLLNSTDALIQLFWFRYWYQYLGFWYQLILMRYQCLTITCVPCCGIKFVIFWAEGKKTNKPISIKFYTSTFHNSKIILIFWDYFCSMFVIQSLVYLATGVYMLINWAEILHNVLLSITSLIKVIWF